MNFSKKLAVVTGASSGIGLAYAKALSLDLGYSLILAARREDRLKSLRDEILSKKSKNSDPITVDYISTDLNLKTDRDRLIEFSNSKGEVSMLVNNAGFGTLKSILESKRSRLLEMVEVNVSSVLDLALAFLPKMAEREDGFIVNVSSILGFQPTPYMACYSASKSFVSFLSIALEGELRGSGVRVITHCPGPTATEFHLASGLKQKISFLKSVSAEESIRPVIQLIVAKKSGVVVPGIKNKVVSSLSRLMPFKFSSLVAAKLLTPYK